VYSRIYWAVTATIIFGFISFFGMGCEDDDDGGGESKLIIRNLSEYEYSDLWVVIHDPVTDSVLQVSHFTEPGSHEIPNVPSLFTLTLVQDEYGMVRISTFPNVKRQSWNLSPLILFVFPDGEVMLQIKLPDANIGRVTATLPGSFAELDTFRYEGEQWAFGSLPYLNTPGRGQSLLVIARGQEQCYANWLTDQTFSEEYDFRNLTVNRIAQNKRLALSTLVSRLYALGHNTENGRWPYIFDDIADEVPFSECELVIPDFPVKDHWLSVETDDGAQMTYTQKFATLPETMTIPQKSVSFGYMDSVRVNNIVVNGSADAVAVSWSASSFEHGVSWTVYAPSSSASISRPTLPDSVISSVGVWADFEPRTLSLYDYQPAANWDQFVYYVARGSSILENGLNGAYQLRYQLYDQTVDSQPFEERGDLVSNQLMIKPQ